METQDTAENLQARLLAAERRLLTEGIPSYSDALMAIQELQQNIQKRCERVLRRGREEFATAIGMRLDPAKIEPYSQPEKISESVANGWTFLGVKIPLQSAGTVYGALEVGTPSIYVALRLRDHGLFDRICEIVKGDEIVKRDESLSLVLKSRWMLIELYKDVPPDRLSSFEDILSDLMGEWSRLWQRVGGLGGVRTQADSLVQ